MQPVPLTFSFSKLSTFKTCPAQFKLKYLDKVGSFISDTEDLSFGKACHLALKEYDDRLKDKQKNRDIRYLKKNMAKWYTSVPGLPSVRFEEFTQILLNHARFRKLDPAEIHSTDLKLAIDQTGAPCDPSSPNVRLVGILDRLDMSKSGKTARITDYKSSRVLSADPLQLLVYAILVALHFPNVESFEMEFDYIRYGFAKPAFSKRGLPISRRRATILRFWEYLKALMDQAETDGTYLPNIGSACERCPYIARCPAKPLLPLAIPDRQHASQVANGILLLERDIKSLRAALKNYIEQYGPVQTGDICFDVSVFQKFTADIIPLIVKYQELGFKTKHLEDLVKLNVDGLKMLMREHRTLAESLSPYIYGSGEEHLTHKIVEKTIPTDLLECISEKEEQNDPQTTAA